MKVDGSINSLIQGVSQQPPRTRLKGQCSLQENMSSNPVGGLTRRPPTESVANLFTAAGDFEFFDIDLGPTQQFVAAVNSSSLRVFDLQGAEKTVTVNGTALSYLTTAGQLSFTSLEGITYIANKGVKVQMKTDTPDLRNYGAVLFLLGGQYGRTYDIKINWITSGVTNTQTVSYLTPDGSTSAHTPLVATDQIATQLYNALIANATINATFDVVRVSDVIYITWKAASGRTDSFTVEVNDGEGGENFKAVVNQARDTGGLPRYAPQNYVVRITGAGNTDVDDWYLKFTAKPDTAGAIPTTGNGFGREGYWVECSAPGVPYLLNNDTMPHILVYDEDTDSFTFSSGTWKGRQVGDEDSNPDPSFVDSYINDVAYFQGRLVILSGPAVTMSRTNKQNDFFVESAFSSSDTDPIDIESTAVGGVQMERAVPHNRDLVIFSAQAQFIIFGRNAITPKNCSLVLTTSFGAELKADPVPAGRNVFFAMNYGRFTGIREFFTEDDTNDSRPITQHVSKYIEGKVERLAATSNFDILLVKTVLSPNRLYCYEYIWIDDKKAQSSWSTWIMPNEVKFFFFVEGVVYLVFKVGTTYVLEKMDLDIQADNGLTYQVKLDRKKTVSNVHQTISNPWTNMPPTDQIVFIQGEGCPDPGMRAFSDSYSGGVFHLKEDMQGGSVIVGQRFTSRYRPTMPMVKDSDGVKVGTGRLIISKFLLNYKETGYVAAKVFSLFRDAVDQIFSGRIVGDVRTRVGEPTVTDGSLIIPFRDNADNAELELFTDSHLPMTLLDIEWDGQYTKRGKRITSGE